MKNLVIVGAGGQGKVVADIALKLDKYDRIYFLNDGEKKECMGLPIVGPTNDIEKYINSSDFFVAIGDNTDRKYFIEKLCAKGASLPTLIHPQAVIGKNVELSNASVIMAGAVVNSCTKIGRGSIINTCSSVDHDCVVGDYVHVSVGAHVCGDVHIGNNCFLGAGTIIKNHITISSNCCFGAGAVVIEDIKEEGTYIGLPAKRLR